MTRIHLAFARAAVLLALCAAPLAAQAPSACTTTPNTAEPELVLYDCTGGHEGIVRFSVKLPAGWQIQEMQEGDVTLVARNGAASIFIQAADQLFHPRTAADSARFWTRAAEMLHGRAPTAGEVAALRREAVDEPGARRMVTEALRTDSAIVALTSYLESSRDEIQVTHRSRELNRLGGGPAGQLYETQNVGGQVWQLSGFIAVDDGVFYGLLHTAPTEEFAEMVEVWDRAGMSFTIHPERPWP
jgi:hypothetical protein